MVFKLIVFILHNGNYRKKFNDSVITFVQFHVTDDILMRPFVLQKI